MWNENENEEMNVAVDSNEIAQNGLEEQNMNNTPSENQMSEPEPKHDGKKNLFIVLGVLVLLLIACVAFAVSVGNSDGIKFAKLLTEDQLFIEMLEDDGKYEQVNVKVDVDMDNIARETNSDELNLGKVTLDTSFNEKGDDFSARAKISASNLDIKIPEVQVMKTGDLVGLNIEKIFPKVISIDLKNPEGLKKNLESLGMEFDNQSDNKEYSEEDYEKLMKFAEKYANVALKELEKGISKEDVKTITLDGEEYKVSNVYALKIDGERLVKTVYAVTKELYKNKNDMKYLEEIGIIEDADELKESLESFLKETEEIIKEEKYDDILDSDIIIKVYERSGKTIATVVEIADVKIRLYTIKKDKNNFDVVLEMTQDDTKAQFIASFEKDKNNMNGSLKIKFKEYDETSMDLEICKFEIEKFKKAEEDMLKVDKDESISLNEASEEELNEFTNQVEENIIELIGPLFAEY